MNYEFYNLGWVCLDYPYINCQSKLKLKLKLKDLTFAPQLVLLLLYNGNILKHFKIANTTIMKLDILNIADKMS